MSDYKAAIGKRVSTLRKMNGMTQENLAELLDCSVKHISHSEVIISAAVSTIS